MSRPSSSASIPAVLFGACMFGGVVAAQCPLPDKLDGGPCCAVVHPKLPVFPEFTQEALEICWRDCDIEQILDYRARWSNQNVSPLPAVPCGERRVLLELKNNAGIVQWSGILCLQYSRTWLETDPAALPLQVWRFLVNGDMKPVEPSSLPCPVPPCAPAFGNRVRFTGYVDYASSCALVPSFYQHAWMLSHVCDFVDHHVGFPRAGAFHPDRSYSIVGPAGSFVPGPLPPPEEETVGSPFEALRRRRFPPPGVDDPITCNYEEPLDFALIPDEQFCLCGPSEATPQWLLGDLTIVGLCTFLKTPGVPLPGFLSMGIGSWVVPGTYPGVEHLRWNAGSYDFDHFDPCSPGGLARRDVFFGVTTIEGYPATQLLSSGPGALLPLTFIDQSNSRTPPAGAGGTVMNVPYVSDHFLSLNH